MLMFKLLNPESSPPPIPNYDVGFVGGVWTNNSQYTQKGSLPTTEVGGNIVLNCTGGSSLALNDHPMTQGDWTACLDVELVTLGDIRIVSVDTAARFMSMGTRSAANYKLCVFSTDDQYFQPQDFQLTNGQRVKMVLKCVKGVGYYLSTSTSSHQLIISPSMFSGNGFCLGYGYGTYHYLIHDFRLFDKKLLTDEQINSYLA